MSDNKTRYREIQTSLEKLYPTQPKGNFARNLNTLAAMISGIVGSKNTQLPTAVRCDLSLFQLGLRLLYYILDHDIPIPVYFHAYSVTT